MPSSANIKRSVIVNGHRTSITLETAFWKALKEIAAGRKAAVSDIIAEIDAAQPENLSSAIRVFVFEHFRRS